MCVFGSKFGTVGLSADRRSHRRPSRTERTWINPVNNRMTTALLLANWDLQCERNNKDHRTSDAGSQRLLVRRGQSFLVTLHFSKRSFNKEVDKLTFHVKTGPRPTQTSGTSSSFPLSSSLKKAKWSSTVEGQDGSSLTVAIFPPPDARIGRYHLTLEISTEGQEFSYDLGEFILLFNPWSTDDTVFMKSEEARVEYVLTQHGQIYQGSQDFIFGCPWVFGQFEEGIVDICLQLLDSNPKFLRNQDKDCSRRNSPVYISRVVSAMVNCNDDKGILWGRWDDQYDDGISPLSWTGSVDILQRWQKSGCQPVRYGQCWVFAAVACTVLRCLGIPTRVVTNFESAHDTNSNLTIERYMDQNGQPRSRESIWNYHCWVESWMGRPDLAAGYDGWQALDSTPQEKSEGVYCCGPAPVKAIKEGDLHVKYDVPFVFAEVNADVVNYVRQTDMSWKKITHTSLVGMKISTKSVGKDTREDITHHYKYPEGSREERAVFKKALHRKDRAPAEGGLKVRIKASEGINNGSDFKVFAVLTNNTGEEHRCHLKFGTHIVSYNGVLGPEIRSKDLNNITLEPYGERTVPLLIRYENYGHHLTQDNMIKILGEPMQKRKLVAELTLTNPLPTPLTGCVFTVEGAGLTDGQKVQEIESPIDPGEEAKVRVVFVPWQSGLRKLVVDFESDKLKGVKGYQDVVVAPKPKRSL
ncbi:protein-glutamine gamma-glutamyltransferase 2-like isoform X2 [Anolis sagrei]|uniref:protein-glutamine gamma-glutamyltransferase 2-like isoform X2 n=1 Tax=Anolis sagrei TaxID=38937 RepID=UPI0035219FAB